MGRSAHVRCSALLWLLHWLPLRRAGGARPRPRARCCTRWPARAGAIALRNLELCFPELTAARARARWRASTSAGSAAACSSAACSGTRRRERLQAPDPRRGRRQPGRAQRAPGDVAGAALHGRSTSPAWRCCCSRSARCVSIYQAQSNPVIDAAMRRGRLRFGNARDLLARRQRHGRWCARSAAATRFFNLPDMDFGAARRRLRAVLRRAGGDAARAVAAGARARHGGAAGGRRDAAAAARATACASCAPWTDFPSDDAVADTARMNRWIEERDPAQPGAVPLGAQALQDAAAGRAVAVLTRSRSDARRDNRAHADSLHQDAGRRQRLRRARRHARAARARRRRRCARLADRRFGVGADQILVVEPAPRAGRRLPLPHLQRRTATRSSSAATARAASSASCATRA